MKTLIEKIGLLATPLGSHPHRGAEQGQIAEVADACVLIEEDRILYAGPRAGCPEGKADRVIDAGGRLVTPGLVDAHTHLVFGGWRQHEVPLKLQGAGYLDILRAGGGILSTVRSTREAGEEELYRKSAAILDGMLALGVTSCEAKSGYGLDLETECKQLRVIRRLQEAHPVDLVPTFLGAHAVPEEYKEHPDDYVDLLVERMIPTVAEEGLAKFCDVFCETGVFDPDQSRRVLKAGKAHGLTPKIHADEIDAIGGAELAGEVHAISAEHLIATDERGMQAMAKAGVIACLLPQTSFYLDKTYAPARRMIELGIPVAIASDFNPGSCPSYNLQLAMNLGLLRYKMQPAEVLSAVTINAACAIGLEGEVGSLEAGKKADLVIWDAPDLDMLLYRFGQNLAGTILKAGKEITG